MNRQDILIQRKIRPRIKSIEQRTVNLISRLRGVTQRQAWNEYRLKRLESEMRFITVNK